MTTNAYVRVVPTFEEASRICRIKEKKCRFTIDYEPRRYVADDGSRGWGVWPINGLDFDVIYEDERC